MCGFVLLSGSAAQRPISHRSLGRLRRRGPDGSGFFAGHGAVIAHARLAVIGMGEQNLQPLEHAGHVLAFNGEIYDWEKHRRLEEHTDGATLLRRIVENGMVETVRSSRGFWALALLAPDGSVQLARDGFGIRPLYYACVPGGLVAASTLRAVIEQLPYVPELDTDAMNEWARYQLPLSDRTFFQGVRRVMPGQRVVFDRDGALVCKQTMEDPWPAGTETVDEAWIRKARELLERCVRDATLADVPFASTCSGGLDSSVVTRIAQPAVAYHANFSDPEFNETSWARHVLEGTPTRLLVHNADERPDLLARLDDLVLDQDDLSIGSVVLPLDELMAQIAKRYRVVLLGTGGDEMFGGYARLEIALGRCGQPSYLRTMHRLEGISNPFDRYEAQHVKGGGEIFAFHDAARARRAFAQLVPGGCRGVVDADGMLAFERKVFLPALLTIDDRIAGRHGIEGRPALLHQDLVRHVCRLSGEAILGAGLKDVARLVFAPFLPRSLLDRRDKKGFPTPIGAMVNYRSAEIRERLTSSPNKEMFRLDKMRWTTEDPFDRTIFGALQLEAWLRSFHVLTGEKRS